MKRRVVDLFCACICLAVIGVAILYPNQIRARNTILVTAILLEVVFLILSIRDKEERKAAVGHFWMGLPS